MAHRFDLRTFLLMAGSALLGVLWAIYQRGTTAPPYDEGQLPALIWIIFATPFTLFWGWFLARKTERWWAAFVCFCFYFFSPFIAARYESCAIVRGSFHLGDCFTATEQAQQLAASNGHRIYFQAIVVIHIIIAIAITFHRAMNQRPTAFVPPSGEQTPA